MHFFSSMIDSYSNKYLVLLVLARYEKIMKAVVSGSRQHNHSQHTHTLQDGGPMYKQLFPIFK